MSSVANTFQQIGSVTWMNLQTLRERLSSSVVSIVGIGGVVAVVLAVLSIAEGFRATMDLSGAEDVAIVLRDGASDEMSSGHSQDAVRVIADAPGVAPIDQGSGPT